MKYRKPNIYFVSNNNVSAVCVSGSSPAIGGDCTLGGGVATSTCNIGAAANVDCTIGAAASVNCVTGDSVGLGCLSGNSA